MELRFCLMAEVANCRAFSCRTHSFFASIGDWAGAGTANAASNSTIFRSCRVYASAGALHSFYIGGSTGCAVDDCIAEGGDTGDNVKYDALSSTNVVYFRVQNLHSENTPTGAVVRLIPNGGKMVIDTIYHQSTNVTLVDDTGTVGGSVIEITVPYISTGSKFKAGGSFWFFRFTGSLGQADLSNTAYWVSATLPVYWNHLRFNSASGAFLEIQGTSGLWNKNPAYFLAGIRDAGGLQVMGNRRTGWGAPTGTTTRTTFATTTVTTEQLAQRVYALIDDLMTHGLIGA